MKTCKLYTRDVFLLYCSTETYFLIFSVGNTCRRHKCRQLMNPEISD